MSGPVRFSVALSGGRSVEKVYLIRDGECLEPVEVGAAEARVELVDPAPPAGRHWYVVTAEGESAFQGGPMYDKGRAGVRVVCHASPFFVASTA